MVVVIVVVVLKKKIIEELTKYRTDYLISIFFLAFKKYVIKACLIGIKEVNIYSQHIMTIIENASNEYPS